MNVRAGDPLASWVTVTVDGVDVTNDCTAADDIQGYAIVLKKNEHGHYFQFHDGNGAARETRQGRVEIALKPGAPPRYAALYQAIREFYAPQAVTP